jgi:hypothetical protein
MFYLRICFILFLYGLVFLTKFDGWISDPDYSKTRDMKIFKVIELYKLTEAFIAQLIEEGGSQYQHVLHKVHMMETKFDTLYK